MLESRLGLRKFNRTKVNSSKHNVRRSIAISVRAVLGWRTNKNHNFNGEFSTLIVSCHPLDLRVV